eukprot:Ihof_evm6s157 gene=Ihof_evmTU6s157
MSSMDYSETRACSKTFIGGSCFASSPAKFDMTKRVQRKSLPNASSGTRINMATQSRPRSLSLSTMASPKNTANGCKTLLV